jgi:hypothetical protein
MRTTNCEEGKGIGNRGQEKTSRMALVFGGSFDRLDGPAHSIGAGW